MAPDPPDRPYPSVLKMTAPLVVSFWMRAAFALVDTIYAATLGDAAVASIGLAAPFEFLMIAAWVGMSTGLTSTLSGAMGARRGRAIAQYLRVSKRMVLIASPVFVGIGLCIWVFTPFVNLEASVRDAFRIYGTTLIIGSGITAFWSVIPDSIVKAHHDTRTTMWAGIASNVTNVALNTIFVFVFHWGVFGIALSTVIGRIAGLVYAMIVARRHEARRLATGRHNEPGEDPTPYRSILSLAVPSSLTFTLMAGEMFIVNGLLARMEHATESIAAYSIFHRVVLFTLNPIIAASVALLPYSATRFGEGDPEGARKGLRETMLFAMAYSIVVVAPVTLPLASSIAGWLAESPLTAQYASFCLRLVAPACLLGAPFLMCRPVFEGMRRGNPGLVMAAIRYIVLTPVVAWLSIELSVAAGWPGLYGLMGGLLAVSAVTSLAFYGWLRVAMRDAVATQTAVQERS
ncbi:MAG: MATE family efflux transporter [Acidobacteriota bacterium]|nr:MATE family efflux transporter [Acidobacteriota bacterium]